MSVFFLILFKNSFPWFCYVLLLKQFEKFVAFHTVIFSQLVLEFSAALHFNFQRGCAGGKDIFSVITVF